MLCQLGANLEPFPRILRKRGRGKVLAQLVANLGAKSPCRGGRKIVAVSGIAAGRTAPDQIRNDVCATRMGTEVEITPAERIRRPDGTALYLSIANRAGLGGRADDRCCSRACGEQHENRDLNDERERKATADWLSWRDDRGHSRCHKCTQNLRSSFIPSTNSLCFIVPLSLAPANRPQAAGGSLCIGGHATVRQAHDPNSG